MLVMSDRFFVRPSRGVIVAKLIFEKITEDIDLNETEGSCIPPPPNLAIVYRAMVLSRALASIN